MIMPLTAAADIDDLTFWHPTLRILVLHPADIPSNSPTGQRMRSAARHSFRRRLRFMRLWIFPCRSPTFTCPNQQSRNNKGKQRLYPIRPILKDGHNGKHASKEIEAV